MTSSNRIFSRARLALTAGIAAAGLLGLATSAQAVTVQAAKTVEAGRTTAVTVVAPGSEQCTLTVPGSHSRPAFLDNGTKVAFSFRVAKTARGSYKVSATCDTTTANTRIKVKGRKRGTRSLALTSGVISGKALDATGDSTSTSDSAANDSTAAEVDSYYQRWFANATYGGACQDWVNQKRHDIVEKIERAKLAEWIAAGKPGSSYDSAVGNVSYWLTYAHRAGLSVSASPSSGSVVVWPAGSDAAPKGHVGYVESVNADGSFVSSDMNINGVPYSMATSTVSAADIARYGLQFIS